MKRFSKIFAALFLLLAYACGTDVGSATEEFTREVYTPRYASGFDIRGNGHNGDLLITIRNPWQGATDVTQHLMLLPPESQVPEGFGGAVVRTPVRRVVCMSSTYIAMFDALGAVELVKGVSGIRFITNDYIRTHRDSVVDVGYDTNLDFERLAAIRPDIVLMYGITGDNTQMSAKLRELGIPYIYIGDYVEESPLGKAEWLMVVAALTDRHERGEELFNGVAERYNALKAEAASTSSRPKVMFNVPYRDTWFMPSRRSYMVRLVEDAGGEYIYPQNDGTSSEPVDSEQAYMLARGADIWLNVEYATLDELRRHHPKFADVKAVREGRVWNCNRRRTPTGGSDFWESGIVRPDRVLGDLVAVMRATDADTTFYYQPLK